MKVRERLSSVGRIHAPKRKHTQSTRVESQRTDKASTNTRRQSKTVSTQSDKVCPVTVPLPKVARFDQQAQEQVDNQFFVDYCLIAQSTNGKENFEWARGGRTSNGDCVC